MHAAKTRGVHGDGGIYEVRIYGHGGLRIARVGGERPVVAQIFEHFAAALVTRVGIFGQRAHDHGADSRMNRRVHLLWRDGFFVDDLVDYRGDVLTGEGLLSRDHFIKHYAQGENVAAAIDGAAFDLFWRHVAGRAHDVGGLLHGAEL